MTKKQNCPQCGKSLETAALQGLCPECLMKAGWPTEPFDAADAAGFVPPSLDDLAQIFPQLVIIEQIGIGGMGVVYKARQPELDRFVALKILIPKDPQDPGFAERFSREARALARLTHPNIVAVYDFGRVDALHYFLMEYVGGVAIGLIAALGGSAVGTVALGGAAFGFLAAGGVAWSVHAHTSLGSDLVAQQFFEPWAHFLVKHVLWFTLAPILRGEGDTQTNTSGAESPRELRELTNMAVFQAGLSKPSSPWPWEALKKRVRSGRLSAGEVERLMEGLVIWVQGDHPDRYHSSLDNLAHFLDELDDQDLISEHDKLEFLTALYGTLEIRPLPRLRQGQRSVTLSGDWSFFWHHRKLFGLDFLTEMGTVAIDGEIIDLSERGHSAAFNPHSFYGKVPLPDLTPGGHQNEGTGTALHVTSGWILFS